MSRVYGEPVDVQARPDGRPLRFVWRSRLYTVRAILEHWVINREWWRDSVGPENLTDPTDPGSSRDPGHPSPGPAPRHLDPGHPEPGHRDPGHPELEFWRIEASPGAGVTPAIYELRHEPATGSWTLRQG